MTNIAELLKNAPKGMKLYSPLFGEVEFSKINSVDAVEVIVTCTDGTQGIERFYSNGTYISRCPNAECLLFPSKYCRTWEGWKVPKSHYDIANFKPFDKVLCRNCNNDRWRADYFSHLSKNGKSFIAIGYTWCQCIPFNDKTKHLLGTTKPCSEEYINW